MSCRKAFNDVGYIEGKNIQLEHIFPAEKSGSVPDLGARTCRTQTRRYHRGDGAGCSQSLKSSQAQFRSFLSWWADPVGFGLVESLGLPWGNATGLSLMTIDLSGKRLEFIEGSGSELVARRVIFVDLADPFKERAIKGLSSCGRDVRIFIVAGGSWVRPMTLSLCFPKLPKAVPMASFL